MKAAVFTAISLSLVASGAWAQSPGTRDFVIQASVSNTFEIEEAKLALQNASDIQVKSFARKMISDHSKAEKKLQAAAKGSGVSVEMMLDPPHQAMPVPLELIWHVFRQGRPRQPGEAHTDTVALLTDYQRMGDSPKLEAWAKRTLPTVKKHPEMVKAMASRCNDGTTLIVHSPVVLTGGGAFCFLRPRYLAPCLRFRSPESSPCGTEWPILRLRSRDGQHCTALRAITLWSDGK